MKLVYGYRVWYVAGVTIEQLAEVFDRQEGVLVAEDIDGRETIRVSLGRVPVRGVPLEFDEWCYLKPPLRPDDLAWWYAPRIVRAVEFLLHPEGGETFSVVPRRYAE